MSGDPAVTNSLEDYLETIFRLLRGSSVARVRDIADELGVTPASVSPAMKRLEAMGLVEYSRRSYIRLTAKGIEVARKTLARHNLLFRFLTEVLGSDPDRAERDACAMEHHLSDGSMERLAAFFEFLAACPELRSILESGFGKCLDGLSGSASRCSSSVCPLMEHFEDAEVIELPCLADITPGSSSTIARVRGGRNSRRRLIDLGFIQGAEVALDRPGNADLPCVLHLDGHRLEISFEEARNILVRPEGTV